MRRGDRGAVAVEFALVVPIFLVLIGIAMWVAWQMFVESQLDHAAARAARYAAVPTTDGTYAYRQCDVVDELNRRLSHDVESSNVTVKDTSGTLAATVCPNGDAATTPSGTVTVTVTRDLDNPFTNVIAFFTGRTKPFAVSGSGEARVEDPT